MVHVRPVILYSRFHSLLTTNSHVVTDRGQAFVKPKRCKFDRDAVKASKTLAPIGRSSKLSSPVLRFKLLG